MNAAFILFLLHVLWGHSLLSLLYERNQSLHFGFRWLQKPFNFLSGIVFLNELPNIEFVKPTIQDLETGSAFLARTTIGKAQVMAKYPAVTVFVVKINISRIRHFFV